MEKIVIFNANNESMQVEVVRYFSESNNKYFVFSLHELDAQGHMNIYVTKTVEQNGTLIGTNIIDDVEWTNLKTNLQRIIKENRTSGNAVVNDLPYKNLENIKIADRRALKLLAASVDMLNLGYNPTDETPNDAVVEPVVESFAQPDVQNQPLNTNIPQENNIDDMSIFGNQQQNNIENVQNQPNNVQNVAAPVEEITNNVQNATNVSTINPQPVQNSVENSPTNDYKDLYFREKENTTRLTEENNRLINELNNCKMIISDIKNILSRQ